MATFCSGFWWVLHLANALLLFCSRTIVVSSVVVLHMQINPEDSLTRQGSNIYSTVPIAYTDAILGTQLDVKTLRGPKPLQVPAGSQHGSIITLSEQGVQIWGAASPTYGAHYVTVHVVLPVSYDAKELQLLELLKIFN